MYIYIFRIPAHTARLFSLGTSRSTRPGVRTTPFQARTTTTSQVLINISIYFNNYVHVDLDVSQYIYIHTILYLLHKP